MIITPKQPRNAKTRSSLPRLVAYMLRGKGNERCTWYLTGNLPGLHRREDAELAVDVMELLQDGNQRAKGNKTYHLVISFHPTDRRLTPAELGDVVARTVRAAGFEEHQYIAVRHSDQEHEHLHVAVNQIHPETLKIHHPYKAVPAYQALARILEEELGLRRLERTKGDSQGHRARDFEAHQCLESFSGWSRRTIGDATELDRIDSWEHLHQELQGFGVRLVPRGSGLAIVDATRSNLACKASTVGRHWSKQRLCERYGEFVPGPGSLQVAREPVNSYSQRPIQSRDDGLWLEYQDALHLARTSQTEQRQALARRVDEARTTQRQQFKLRHHAIAAMPISAHEKRKHYKVLSFERKAAERKLRAEIRHYRAMSVNTHPGSWKQFLAARAARGDRRAMRRLAGPPHRAAIVSDRRHAQTLSPRTSRTSRGSIVHNLSNGIRLRESARSIELLGDASNESLEQLVKTARERFGSSRVTLLGPKNARTRLARIAADRGLEIAQERER